MHKTILKRSEVEFAEGIEPAPPAPFGARPVVCAIQKRVVLVEHAGAPCAIEFTCSCGERTLIEIEYRGDQVT